MTLLNVTSLLHPGDLGLSGLLFFILIFLLVIVLPIFLVGFVIYKVFSRK